MSEGGGGRPAPSSSPGCGASLIARLFTLALPASRFCFDCCRGRFSILRTLDSDEARRRKRLVAGGSACHAAMVAPSSSTAHVSASYTELRTCKP